MHSRSRRQVLKDGFSLAGAAILGGGVLSRTTQHTAGHERLTREETLADLPLSRMIELLEKKDTCPTEVITAHIDRIREWHSKINAVVYLDEQRALAAAKVADHKLIAGDVDFRREFLFGIPFSVKNTMYVEGVPTVCGVPAYQGKIAREDAYYVKKYKDAGAIFLAATNLPFLSFGMESDNAVFGRTNNPHDLTELLVAVLVGKLLSLPRVALPWGLPQTSGVVRVCLLTGMAYSLFAPRPKDNRGRGFRGSQLKDNSIHLSLALGP